MTLIAMATNHGQPFVTADILITSKSGKPGVVLPQRPTPLSPDEVQHLASKPSRLVQKLYVIQPNICIAVAGTVHEIKLMLEDFRIFCRVKSSDGAKLMTIKEVAEFFAGYDMAVMDKIACGVMVVQVLAEEYSLPFVIQFGKWEGVKSPDFENVRACGSGKTQYLKHIELQHSMGSSHEAGDLLFARQMTFIFIAKLLAKERKTFKSLENYWGAFLETCFYNGNNFEKVGEIAFVISDADCDGEGNMSPPHPQLFIYSQYIDEVLYLTAVETENLQCKKTDESLEFTSDTCKRTLFAVEEMNALPGATLIQDNADLSFKANEVAMGYHISLSKKASMAAGSYAAGTDVSIKFTDQKQLKFIWPHHVQEKVTAQVKEVYPLFKDKMKDDDEGMSREATDHGRS